MKRDKKPLWRKENKIALHYRGDTGGEFRHSRHTKKDTKRGMGGKKQRGVDYTPLFKFLLSKVGQNWDSVYSEAISRLDKKDPIFWMVYTNLNAEMKDSFRAGESSQYSCLFVDDNNILQLVNPNLSINDFKPSCHCCTHTFNGKVIK